MRSSSWLTPSRPLPLPLTLTPNPNPNQVMLIKNELVQLDPEHDTPQVRVRLG